MEKVAELKVLGRITNAQIAREPARLNVLVLSHQRMVGKTNFLPSHPNLTQKNVMVEIQGEVDQKERSQIMRPGVVKPDPKEFTHIPVFRLRILTSSGKLVQVLYKGEPPGDADIGEQVIVKGIDRGGVIHARSIYNLTTNSWVTTAPGFLQKLFGDLF